jgi:hypothetical protein
MHLRFANSRQLRNYSGDDRGYSVTCQMLVSGKGNEVAIRRGIAVFSNVAPVLEIGLRFAIDGYRSRSSRGAKLERANRGSTMLFLETLPGESDCSIISSIINLVCPQCGGSMMEFQCNGRCRRNWFAEWEWVHFATAIFGAGSRTAKRQAKN